MKAKKEITLSRAIWQAILGIVLAGLVFLIATILLESGAKGGERYQGIDPRVFDQGIVVYPTNAHKKIESPDKSWTWYNSWQVVHRQSGVFGIARVDRGGYTLSNSFASSGKSFKEYTWVHFSFFLYKGKLPESYDPVKPVEDRIWKRLHQSARVIRIDKLAKNFYVVMYVRSDHKKFEVREVDSYPPFNLGDNVGITSNGIIIGMRVMGLDPYSAHPRKIFTYQRAKILIKNVVLLNPTFFQNPTELQTIFILYKFFGRKEGFLYQYPGVATLYRQSGDPVLVKITEKGIELKFRKPVEYDILR